MTPNPCRHRYDFNSYPYDDEIVAAWIKAGRNWPRRLCPKCKLYYWVMPKEKPCQS